MNEKKPIKVSLSTFFLIIAIIVIAVMGYFIYRINSEKIATEEKVTSLNSQVNNLQERINKVSEITSNTEVINNNTANETKQNGEIFTIGKELKQEMPTAESKKIYEKVIFSKQFLSLLIEGKNYQELKFTDEEILKLLYEIDSKKNTNKIFNDSTDSTGFYVSAKIDEVQKMSDKYFGRELNINNLKEKNGDKIKIEIPSGFGIIEDKFVAGYKMDNGDIFLSFEQIDKESTGSLTYGVIIKYDEKSDSVIYKGFTNDSISYISNYKKN